LAHRSACATSATGRRATGPNFASGYPIGISAYVSTSAGILNTCLTLGLVADLVGGDQGREPERAAGENNILHRRIDTGAANALNIGDFLIKSRLNLGRQGVARRQLSALHARHQQHRRGPHVIPQIRARGHEAAILLIAHVLGPRAMSVNCARDVGSLAIDRAESGALIEVAHDDKGPALRVASGRSPDGRVENAGQQMLRYRIGLEPTQGPCGIHGLEQCDVSHCSSSVASMQGANPGWRCKPSRIARRLCRSMQATILSAATSYRGRARSRTMQQGRPKRRP
jgi:hypothetical protein